MKGTRILVVPLKPGFHMIVWVVPIVPVVSKNVQTIWTILWKRYPDDHKRPGRLRRPRSLDRVEFYPDDRDDRVNFEAIIIYGNALRRLRRSGRSKAIPQVITFNPIIENKFGPDGAEAEKIMHKCSQRVRAPLKTPAWEASVGVI